MSKTILIDDVEATRSAYALNLTTYVGTEIVDRKGPRDTIDLLEVLSDFDLIITRQTVRGKNAPKLILDYLKTKNISIPMIVLGQQEGAENTPHIHYLAPPIQVKDLIELASKVLGVVVTEIMEKRSWPNIFLFLSIIFS